MKFCEQDEFPQLQNLKKKKKNSGNEWNVRKDYHFYIHPRLRGTLEDKQLSKETPCLFFHWFQTILKQSN